MKSLPWLRLYTEIIDDEKLGLLAFEDRWHFVALLCLKGKGVLDNEPDAEMLRRKIALKMGLTCAELEKVASRLSRMGLIDFDTFQPCAWEERQMQSDTSTERTKAYRERMKRHRDVTVTAQELDTEVDTDKEKEGEKKASAYAPPLPDDLLKDFLAVRKAKKAGPITKTVMAGIAREAEKAGVSLIDAVTACCEFGWQGFNAQWYAERTKPAAAPASRYPDKNAIPPVSAIWHESAAGVAAKAVELGLAPQGDTESHPAFKRRVSAALDRPAPGINELAAMAARRGA